MKKFACVLLVLSASLVHAGFDVILTSDCSISSNDFSYDFLNVQIDGATVTMDGAHSFSNLTLINGAVVTHSACTENSTSYCSISVEGLLYLEAGTQVNADGRGYPKGRTSGNTTSGASKRRSGGSYGGAGGDYMGSSCEAYGHPHDPSESGSGAGSSARAGAGGGLIKIEAGSLEIDGAISANGQVGKDGGGGGSGGGIRIDVGSLQGNGTISANGGSVEDDGKAGGGGGRIALYYGESDDFDISNNLSAYGGEASYSGSAGSIYLKANGGPATIVYDNCNVYSDKSTDLRLFVDEGDYSSLALRRMASVVAPEGHLVVSNLTISQSAKLTHPAVTSEQEYRAIIAALGTISIDESSSIDVSGRGYLQDYTLGNTSTGGSSGRSGGSYGGLGGEYMGRPNEIYGDPLNPAELGSGAGEVSRGGCGGGLVRITARKLVLNGIISADGENGKDSGGGGSGGGIYVDALEFTGSGTISADGGASGSSYSGGGGGGRIAVYDGGGGGCPYELSVSQGAGRGSPSAGTLMVISNAAPPRIQDIWPSGWVSESVTSIRVTLSSPLDTPANSPSITLCGPEGDVPVDIHVVDLFTLSLDVPDVGDLEGEYTLVVGTNMLTINGGIPECAFTNRFVIDTTAPNPPTIYDFPASPATNSSTNTIVVFSGFRDDNTSVWLDDSEVVASGAGIWTYSANLVEGENELSFYCVDLAGNVSPTPIKSTVVNTKKPPERIF